MDSSSSSSSKRRRNYDVFLSFRGTDVRNNFVDHLYTAVDHSGINTYIDSEELGKGEQISTTLMEAIEESKIAIIAFSENYASSLWCLEEAVKIMECKEQRGLVVFPVFYKVEPREVRTPGKGKGERQSYGEAIAEHKIKFGKDSEKVKRWQKALLDAGSLSGWHHTDGYVHHFFYFSWSKSFDTIFFLKNTLSSDTHSTEHTFGAHEPEHHIQAVSSPTLR
ncbi:disease resistance protein RPV1-like [Eucalyptus grandis]|uniref:disease resistance protein RPV1-like n=1 Tax=Eucalyptus grandis TaxID=71139 RepID=UPI00192EEA55|nr:disease resistance protein RPV1-like [Eucalyptus grandis]